MSEIIKEIDNRMLSDLLEKHDKGQYFGPPVFIDADNDLSKEIISNLELNDYLPVTVLGIDICKYSSYKVVQQSLIPFLFELLYNQTISDVKKHLSYIFQLDSKEQLESRFIPTGDGGFQLFRTPIHAILFTIWFGINQRSYNSFHCYRKLRAYIGEIRVRYCITHGLVYKYRENYYGRAIINNSRILSRDRLDRFLMDRKTYEWFMLQINGLENMGSVSLEDIQRLAVFKEYNPKFVEHNGDNIPLEPTSWTGKFIKAVDVQSIGVIGVKESQIDIYNVHIQIRARIENPIIDGGNTTFTISIGNLNTQGLEPE